MQLKQMQPLVIMLCVLCLVCNAVSPFKNRGNGIAGVMMNTANPPPNLLTPILSSHGHGGIRPQNFIFGDKYGDKFPQYQTPVPSYSPLQNFQNKFHSHFGHQQHQNHKPRQFRNPFDVVFEWRQLDFEYPTFLDRQRAILNGDFIPTNSVPLGVDRWRNRLFVTMPRWKNGIPASLASLPLPALDRSPPMRPYPSWDWHANPEAIQPDCTRLMSVYRIWVDECDRLWILDSGVVNATIQINPVCPPKILVFDLRTDQPIFSYELPPDQVKEDSLHSNLVVDIRNGRCNDAYAYITDVWRFGITVFSLAKVIGASAGAHMGRSWRTAHHFFFPNPEACDYTLNGLNFQWTDGVFGMSLSPVNEPPDRQLFFHPMSSFGEFIVSTSVLRNESAWTLNSGGQASSFLQIGDRGSRGQSSTSAIDRNNVQFYTLVQQNAIGCWNADQPYFQNSIDIIAQDNTTLVFPNDLKVDQELDQGVWVLSNRLPVYLYSQLDFTDINFRIQRASTRDAILGTACDTNILKQPLHTLAMP